jgi:hypothetical protein
MSEHRRQQQSKYQREQQSGLLLQHCFSLLITGITGKT